MKEISIESLRLRNDTVGWFFRADWSGHRAALAQVRLSHGGKTGRAHGAAGASCRLQEDPRGRDGACFSEGAVAPPAAPAPRGPISGAAWCPAPPTAFYKLGPARGGAQPSPGPQRAGPEHGAVAPPRCVLPTYAVPPPPPRARAPPAPACPRLVTLFVAAGAMRLGPKPAVLGLLILCASAAGSGDAEELHYAQGEHRTDYDREALLGGQVRRPGRGCAAASPPQPPRALSGDKEGRQATLGRPDRGDPGGTSLAL